MQVCRGRKGKEMKKETLLFGETSAEIKINDNILYIKVVGPYTDEVALDLIRHIGIVAESIQPYIIRVWDGSEIPPESFKLTQPCIDKIAEWSQDLKRKKPGSKAYMIGSTQISFGMARMYQMTSDSAADDIIVLRAFKELPEEIKSKILE